MINIPPSRRQIEPVACARKYLVLASVSCWDIVVDMRGRKESRFSSRPDHMVNQSLADKAIRVPEMRVVENSAVAGVGVSMKSRRG